VTNSDRILLAHGGGGSLTHDLIARVLAPALANPRLRTWDDSAVLPIDRLRLAFTTDSYVVQPYEFPGGDIGRLAVCGTANDLAMQAAQPLWLSLGLILEEGFPLADLERIVASIKTAATEAGVEIVTGDTKVVEHGKCEGVYINTAGIGRIAGARRVSRSAAKPGDAVLLSGPLGDHGVAVMSRRQGIEFQTSITSDCAPVWPLVKALLDTGAQIHTLRDPTRGGVAAALNDIATASGVGIRLDERALPIRREVQGVCDLLGLDPLTIANEGKVLVICRGADADRVLATMRRQPLGQDAVRIGEVTAQPAGLVVLQTTIGGERIVDMPTGEDLPRIC
jgi:hydrogenase expression/formation protein HypE